MNVANLCPDVHSGNVVKNVVSLCFDVHSTIQECHNERSESMSRCTATLSSDLLGYGKTLRLSSHSGPNDNDNKATNSFDEFFVKLGMQMGRAK